MREGFSFVAMRISVAPYRWLFNRPFPTAHGTRDGTDSVFVRIEHDDFIGYGEATLPPYLKEKPDQVIAAIRSMRLTNGIALHDSAALIDEIEAKTPGLPATRNALSMAVFDIQARMAGVPLWEYWHMFTPGEAMTVRTIATAAIDDVEARLDELPPSHVLKVKLGSSNDFGLLEMIKALDDRPLLLDANQACSSVTKTVELLKQAGRVVGIEQPFAADDLEKHAELQRNTSVTVIADESIQGLEDLPKAEGVFTGVNIKLMKCGGLADAGLMIRDAHRMGLKVMLGSMSESSLGCLAMYHLAGGVDCVDLDGPWLIANDPFDGMRLLDEPGWIPRKPGVGARLRVDLPFTPIST